MISEIPLEKMTLYGITGSAMVPLGTIALTDNSKRQEVVEAILSDLANNEKVILYGTLIHTEAYDAFRLV